MNGIWLVKACREKRSRLWEWHMQKPGMGKNGVFQNRAKAMELGHSELGSF